MYKNVKNNVNRRLYEDDGDDRRSKNKRRRRENEAIKRFGSFQLISRRDCDCDEIRRWGGEAQKRNYGKLRRSTTGVGSEERELRRIFLFAGKYFLSYIFRPIYNTIFASFHFPFDLAQRNGVEKTYSVQMEIFSFFGGV